MAEHEEKKKHGLSEAGEKMREKGTVGLFGKKAKAAGVSEGKFAREKAHAGGKLGEEANFAKMAKRHWKPLAKK